MPFGYSKAEQESLLLAEEISKQFHFIEPPKNPLKASMRKNKLCIFFLALGNFVLL